MIYYYDITVSFYSDNGKEATAKKFFNSSKSMKKNYHYLNHYV